MNLPQRHRQDPLARVQWLKGWRCPGLLRVDRRATARARAPPRHWLRRASRQAPAPQPLAPAAALLAAPPARGQERLARVWVWVWVWQPVGARVRAQVPRRARGQAWGIYGLALAYGYTGDPGCLTDAKRLANYFLDHLPEDRVCYWDLIFTQGSEERDSSAAAIAVQGLHLLASFLGGEDSDRQRYAHQADLILSSLVRGYTTRTVPESNGILLHAVYHKPNGIGVNECTVWGDYFYMEALGMKLHSAMTFW